ncbi:MAG TPA: PilZ domain-containing protein [Stenomitos sp.]
MERRFFARGESHLPCTLEIQHGDQFAPPVMAQFENISGGGARVLTRETLPEGALARVSVNMGDEGEQLFTARIIRVEPLEGETPLFRVGFEYVEIDPALRDHLFWFATEHLGD